MNMMTDEMLSRVTNPSNDVGIDRGKQFVPNNNHTVYSVLAQVADARALAPNIGQADRDDIEAVFGKPLEEFLIEQCGSKIRRPMVWIRGDETLGMCRVIQHNDDLHIWVVARDDCQHALPHWLEWSLNNASMIYGPVKAITRSNRKYRLAMFKSLGMSFVGIDNGGAVYQYEYQEEQPVKPTG